MSLLGSVLGSVVGGLFGLAGGAQQQHSAIAQIERQAELQRENWEYAQKNAHQFEIEDLRNAGLNPILSATHSQLASMPSVGSASGPSAYGQLGTNVTAAISSALQNERKKEEISVEQEKVKLEQERVKLLEQSTASGISLNEKQIDKLDNDISLANKNFEVQKKLAEGSYAERLASVRELDARARKLLADSDLTQTEKLKLGDQLKYGMVIASYLPKDIRDLAYNNIVSWCKTHESDITDFISALPETKSERDRIDLIHDLFRFEIKRDPDWWKKLGGLK